MPPKELSAAASHCSHMEEIADEAERSLKDVKKFRFLEANGGVFDAVVGKVARFGLFVDVPALAAGGLVHVSTLSRRFVRYDERSMTLGDGRSTWRIGDRMRLRVLKVDWENRWVDFAPAGDRDVGGRGRGRAPGGASGRKKERRG